MSKLELPDAELLALIEPIMDNLMAGSTAIDHAMHTRDFTGRMLDLVSPERLEEMCQRYQSELGLFTDRELISLVRRPDAVAVLWRQNFSKAAGDFVAEALFVEEQGELLVDHAMVW
ncbi:MAG: hypothetical protein NXH85_15990 [Pseudomonadaceae bacterium]|nr:hypothetical protein [Pseudomonadaceae bacterium]